jgi:phosphate uptake regulator
VPRWTWSSAATTSAAERVIGNDDAIDALEHEVSHDVIRLLALRQPMAATCAK